MRLFSSIFLDIQILLKYSDNKPDLMIHDPRTKEVTLIEVGISNKDILAKVESEKSLKYHLLANELKCLYPCTIVTIIPAVMTWDGLVTRYFKHYIKQLGVEQKLLAYMLTVDIISEYTDTVPE